MTLKWWAVTFEDGVIIDTFPTRKEARECRRKYFGKEKTVMYRVINKQSNSYNYTLTH